MFRRTSAAALASLAFTVSAAHAQTSREIFTPVQQDLALANLRKILGCVVDGVWTAASCDTENRPLIVALGYFNVGCLIVATILACYLVYSLVADTANDGQAFGRGSSAQYTLLRAITGVFLSLPIKSGLSLAQILVVQIAVWGSGFGDTLWTRVAGTQLNGMYGTVTSPTNALGDFALRGKLAQVLQGRLYGHVCAQALQTYANNVSGNTGTASVQSQTKSESASWWPNSTSRSVTYGFADANGYFRSSDSLCGAVVYQYERLTPVVSDSTDSTTTSQLLELAERQSQASFQAAIASLDSAASSIASTINAGTRNDTQIKQQIKAAIDSAYNSVTTSLTSNNNTQLQNALQSYLSNASQNGWLSAALWQRSLSAVQAKMFTAPGAAGAAINLQPPASIYSYIPNLKGTAYAPLADEAQRNLTYVATFGGYIALQGQGVVFSVASNNAAAVADDQNKFTRGIAWIYASLLDKLSNTETTTWRDPILDVQSIGQSMSTSALWITAGGVGADFTAWALDLAGFDNLSKLATALSGPAYLLAIILFVAAFLLVGLVPFIVVIHFLMATFNWFLVIAEAMIAVPIWLLTKFMPARSPSFVGNSGQGYLFFLGILLRPPLIVIGLIASLLLMRVGIDITNLFFRGALAMLSPDGTIAYAMVGTAGLFVYAIVLFSIVTLAAGQISALPETVLSWIGAQIARNAGSGAAVAAGALILPNSPNRIPGSATHRGVAALVGGVKGGSRSVLAGLKANKNGGGKGAGQGGSA